MFNYLYDKLSDKVGEDCAIKILEISGFVEITFKPKIISEEKSCYGNRVQYMYRVDNRLRKLVDKYNYLIDKKEGKRNPYMIGISSMENIESVSIRMRNIIFRHNINVYYLEDVIYDKILNNNQVPIGKVYKKNKIFKNNTRIQYLDFTEYNGEYYLVLNFVDELINGEIKYKHERIY